LLAGNPAVQRSFGQAELMQSEKGCISDGGNYHGLIRLTPPKDQQFQMRLHRHNQKLLATIVCVLLAYFTALIAVCYYATHRAVHSIEQALRNSGHWNP
jgi:hypothetical protein